MKRNLLALAAVLLSLSLLCGCSEISLESIGDFLSGENSEKTEAEESNAADDTADQPEEEREMASEAVMNTAEAPEVLQLAY